MPAPAPIDLDELTVERARRGEAAGFRAVVDRHGRQVHALLYRMVEHAVGAARVDELTQETFVRVHRALPRFDPRGPARLGTWILTIASRLALNELRDREPVALPLEAAAEVAGGEPADRALERARQGARVRAALARLAPDHRAVVVLREYHDLDYPEIASALAIEVGTVKSRLSRARAELRRLLEDPHA